MKRAACVLMSVVLVLTGLICFGMTSGAAYEVGDYIYFGSYPQTDVTASLGSTLDAIGGGWTSYGYSGASSMRYKDVIYNNVKYRGVTFDDYRPIFTNYSAAHNCQKDNGYIKGNVYWFKYEPLLWRVLDPSTGFIMCDTIIDAQTFNDSAAANGIFKPNGSEESHYTCDYSVSGIRDWLNGSFYKSAFSATEKNEIKTTELENKSAFSSAYDSASTSDKVFLLSLDEATNSAYGFLSDAETTDFKRLMEGTDYAKCQGLWVCRDKQSDCIDYSCWRLRTAYTPSFVCGVENDGRVNTYSVTNKTNVGVCPALKVKDLNAIGGLVSIAVKTMPSKTVYTVGDSFNQTGLTLTATYKGGFKKTITKGFTCSGFSSATAGTQKITVTYEGKTATFNVTVNEDTVKSITIKTNPTKTSYFVGDSLDTAGLALTATYDSGKAETVTSGFTCSPTELNTAGAQKITVTYAGKTANFNVTVNEDTVKSIAIKTNPTKTSYFVGDSLDTAGLTLTATYDSGKTETVTSGFTCSPTELNTAGAQKITVTYAGKTATFYVTVNNDTVKSLAVDTKPTKTEYYVGDTLDTSGLALTATYMSGKTETITSGFSCAGFSSAAPGISTITVTYEGKTTTFNVTVSPASATLTGIAVKTMPTKTVYTYRNDTELDLAGLEIEALYSDGSTAPIDPAACTFTGYSAKPRGEKTITVGYEGQTTQFNVTVKCKFWQWLIIIFLLGFIWY